MAQKTSWNGAALTESDINLYLMGEGGAWTTWTPTITQSGSVTCTVNRATYGRWGRMIQATAFLTVTGTGTASNAVVIGGLPAAAAYSTGSIGYGAISDLSATRTYPGIAALSSTTAFVFLGTSTVSADIQLGVATSAFTAALANTDQISFTIMYEAAS
jgi:hypothetical protein